MNDLQHRPSADVTLLSTLPFWEWPPDGASIIDRGLRAADAATRRQAVELVHLVMNDALAGRMLEHIATDEDDEVRAAAATALGPALEEADIHAYDGESTCMLSPTTVARVKRALRQHYHDASTPDVVRRRILETSVRAREPWHEGAVRGAWLAPAVEWQVTAAFAMGYVSGFDDTLLDALRHERAGVRHEAVRACGMRELRAAARPVARMVLDETEARSVRNAAVDALPRLDAILALATLRRARSALGAASSDIDPALDAQRARIEEALRTARLWRTLDDDESDTGFGLEGVDDDDLYDDG